MDTTTLKSRIARHQLALALVLGGVLTNLADLWMTLSLSTPGQVETNPAVLSIGWGPWVAIKIIACVGLVGTWAIARDHRWSTPVAAGPLLVGLIGTVGNAAVSGWTATDAGTIGLVAAGLSAVLVLAAVVPGPRFSRPSKDTATAVVLAMVVLTTPVLGTTSHVKPSSTSSASASAALQVSPNEYFVEYNTTPDNWTSDSTYGGGYKWGNHDFPGLDGTGPQDGMSLHINGAIMSPSSGSNEDVTHYVRLYDDTDTLLVEIQVHDESPTAVPPYEDEFVFKLYNESGGVVSSKTITKSSTYLNNQSGFPPMDFAKEYDPDKGWKLDVLADNGSLYRNLNSTSGWVQTGRSASEISYIEYGAWSGHDNDMTLKTGSSYVEGRAGYNEGHFHYENLSVSWTSGSTPGVSGSVVNQDGVAVENATVEVWSVDSSAITATGAQSKLDRAKELLADARNPKPPEWDSDLQLTGSGGHYQEAEVPYVAVHREEDWALTSYSTSAKLRNPQVQLPADEEVVLSVWDGSKEGVIEDAIDSQLPGKVDDDTDIVIESVGANGDVVGAPQTVETDSTYSNDVIGGVSTVSADFAKVSLPAGFYRVYPKDHPESSYIIVVGDPSEIGTAIQQDLETQASTLTSQAQSIRDKVDAGKFTRTTTTTNASGEWSVAVGENVNVVAVQAYKKPAGLTSTSAENLTLEDMRTYYASTDYNGSFILPSEAKEVETPASDVTVEVVEAKNPFYADLDRYGSLEDVLDAYFANLSYADLPAPLQQQLDNVSRERLETLASEQQALSEQNAELKDRIAEIRDGEPTSIDEDSATEQELIDLIKAQQQAMSEMRSKLDAETSTDVGKGAVTSSATFPGDLSKEQVTVIAQWSNGTSRVVDESYLSYSQSAAASASNPVETTVTVEDFPVGSDDPATVQFKFRVATNDGIGSTTTSARNPTYDGTVSKLDSIALSTLHPGPSETVTMTVNPDTETDFDAITGLEVNGPNGVVTSNITGDNTATFKTDGEGVYRAEVTYENLDGDNFSTVYRVKAADTDYASEAQVRVAQSPTGTYALVGDGLSGGTVNVKQGGSATTVVAQVAEGDDIPDRIHVHTTGLDLPASATTTVRAVRGEDQQAVSEHVRVVLHSQRLPDGATLYANEKALPVDGNNQFGSTSRTADSLVVKTWTDKSGVLEIKSDANPGIIERLRYRFDKRVDLPFGFIFPAGGLGGLAAAGLLFGRRRRLA